MSFYGNDSIDKENDKDRFVRKYRGGILGGAYSVKDYWMKKSVNSNFMIAGGRSEQRIWGLYYAIEADIHYHNRTIIILSNQEKLDMDATLSMNFQVSTPGMPYTVLGSAGNKKYDFFAGMSIPNIVEVIKGQACLVGITNPIQLASYTTSFLQILHHCPGDNPLSLNNMIKLNERPLEEIVQLGQNYGENTFPLTNPVNLGMQECLSQILKIFSNMTRTHRARVTIQGRKNSKSITELLQENYKKQIISININDSMNYQYLLNYLSKEIASLNENVLVIFNQVRINDSCGTLPLIQYSRNHCDFGIVTDSINNLLDHPDDDFKTIKGYFSKYMILHHATVAGAELLSTIAGACKKKVKMKIVAPVPFWVPQIIAPKAPGMTVLDSNRIEAEEITEMGDEAAIFYGHANQYIDYAWKTSYV